MKKIIYLILNILVFSSLVYAQGISRSTGLGLRVGFWQHDQSTEDYRSGFWKQALAELVKRK